MEKLVPTDFNFNVQFDNVTIIKLMVAAVVLIIIAAIINNAIG